ncbi:hypothetical protein AvCA_43430 [Azotobacter vinelandii CA]|uniref:Uncharacterized protein n=2 Tax=Azotobacter vinelandii TaxID=354 RepID=C1DFR8_AZOVD|nr:hypothetical protein Avin_43430 [Azotobacter vinelandii DJ]AGK14389.1 hypothetical protein AvCA_43430 [Azotobacter vinelandii CA]AGK21927.1 hypothetical protein AvCA6_43430 [Azotobacter vinelandii CA6]
MAPFDPPGRRIHGPDGRVGRLRTTTAAPHEPFLPAPAPTARLSPGSALPASGQRRNHRRIR